MSLLAKFNAVKVTADSRITAADRAFCEAHQAAYDAACVSLRDLAEMAEKAEKILRDGLDKALEGLWELHNS